MTQTRPDQTRLTRRAALAAASALPFMPLLAAPARAAAPLQGPAQAPFHRAKLGGFEVTTLLAGSRAGDKPQEIFGLNVSPEEFRAASEAAFLPADRSFNSFSPVLVNTGAELVLFDTGLSAEGTLAALASAGIAPDQVDVVVLTHMHGDHIGGLIGADGAPTFAKARYVTGAQEYDFWAGQGDEGFDQKVRPLAERMTMLDDGGSVAQGITAMAAPGHTPGHFAYLLESDGARMALLADTTNHYVWSLAHPDWEVRYDRDKAQAAQTRRRMLDMLAAERIPFAGYHMPFPAIGYVETAGDGFRYVPASYQLQFG